MQIGFQEGSCSELKTRALLTCFFSQDVTSEACFFNNKNYSPQTYEWPLDLKVVEVASFLWKNSFWQISCPFFTVVNVRAQQIFKTMPVLINHWRLEGTLGLWEYCDLAVCIEIMNNYYLIHWTIDRDLCKHSSLNLTLNNMALAPPAAYMNNRQKVWKPIKKANKHIIICINTLKAWSVFHSRVWHNLCQNLEDFLSIIWTSSVMTTVIIISGCLVSNLILYLYN